MRSSLANNFFHDFSLKLLRKFADTTNILSPHLSRQKFKGLETGSAEILKGEGENVAFNYRLMAR
jgi:hypothetical protein